MGRLISAGTRAGNTPCLSFLLFDFMRKGEADGPLCHSPPGRLQLRAGAGSGGRMWSLSGVLRGFGGAA